MPGFGVSSPVQEDDQREPEFYPQVRRLMGLALFRVLDVECGECLLFLTRMSAIKCAPIEFWLDFHGTTDALSFFSGETMCNHLTNCGEAVNLCMDELLP